MKVKAGIVNYGIIGAGMMGREHLLNIKALDGAAVVAIADPHVPSQDAALAISPHIKVFSDHNDLLESGICDVLIVSTPNNTHAAIVLDILKHHNLHHVLVEKPLCTNIEDCYKVIEAAKARPEVLVQVGLEYRYMPPVAELINIVKSNVLGKVKMVAIREHRFPFLVKVREISIIGVEDNALRWMCVANFMSALNSLKVQNWNRFNSNTGGTLVEKCCHFFDLMNLITGATPVRVMASGAQNVNHLDESYNGQVPDIIDNAYVILEYDNGVRGMLDLCMFAEGGNNEQEICVVGDIGKGEAFVPESIVRFGTRIGGRKGVQTLEVHDDRIKYDGLHHGSSYLEHLDFLAAVKSHDDRPPMANLYDGLLSVAVGMAAQRSIELGKSVSISDILENKTC